MADVTAPRPARAAREPGHDAADGYHATTTVRTADGAASGHELRVRLALEGPDDPPAIRVAPPPAPPGPGDTTNDAGVLAQRRPRIDREPVDASLRSAGRGRVILAEGGTTTKAIVQPLSGAGRGARRLEVLVGGFRFEVDVEPERLASLRERATRARAAGARRGPLDVRAIIPGKVLAVSVVPGDAVTPGQQLLVVEAMKMQNELRAPRAGTVERVEVGAGRNIEVGDLLLVIGEEAP